MRIYLLLISSVLLSACTSSGEGQPAINGTPFDITSAEATYTMTFTAQWSAPNFTFVPPNAHFTAIVVSAVNDQADLWVSGETASAGLENLAPSITTTFVPTVLKG